MGERYKLSVRNGNMHLMKEASLFDDDCGKLSKTFTGKLKTNNVFSTNYILEDISPMFSSGTKYKLTKSNGEEGIMIKVSFSEYYEYQALK